MTISTNWKPRLCAWEITLACDARCIHCGSSAGMPRTDELSTDEAFSLIDELAELGCDRLTLSGGEPFIRRDWPKLAARTKEKGIQTEAITNGLTVARQAEAIVKANFHTVTFSVDGTTKTFDQLRGVSGGLHQLLDGVRAIRDTDTHIGAVTQINKINLHELREIHDLLVNNGFEGWQVQLTIPNGRARDNQKELCLVPEDMLELEEELLRLLEQSPIFIQAADNVGYLGRGEPRLRRGSSSSPVFWTGCQAGLQVIGITSNGTIRGCLSMPDALNEGNVRQNSLRKIWNAEDAFVYNRQFNADNLEASCQGCKLGKICRGGCKSQAYATIGNFNSNPYCLRRLYDEHCNS